MKRESRKSISAFFGFGGIN